MTRGTVIYAFAFLAGCVAAWAVMALRAGLVFDDPISLNAILSLIFPPLAGLSVFALVFGFAMRTPLGLQFWLVALPLTFAVIAGALAAIYQGYATPLESLVLGLLALLILGWLSARPLMKGAS